MNKPRQCIILGGGSTIAEGISKGLWEKLKHKFVIGINYSYNHFNATFQVYLDYKLYNKNKKDLDKLPLIITKPGKKLPINTLQIKTLSTYNRDVRKGCYKGSLSGIYSVSLGIRLLDEGDLVLLGYDYDPLKDKNGKYIKDKKGRFITHYYQNVPDKNGKIIEHRGIGKINYYGAKGRVDRDFTPFKNEKKVRIFNVSLQSKINTFPKISYDQFFKMLDKNIYDQTELRAFIKTRLK